MNLNPYQVTLSADGHEPFVHLCSAADEAAAAQFVAELWMLGQPDRRTAQNIFIVVADAP